MRIRKTKARLQTLTFLTALALSSFLLAGCTGPVPRTSSIVQPHFAQKKIMEEDGWARVSRLSPTKCGVTPAPPPRNIAVSQSTCVTELVREHVLPYAAFPALVLESREQAMELAARYRNGKISATQYQLLSQARLKKYRADWLEKAAAKAPEPDGVSVSRL